MQIQKQVPVFVQNKMISNPISIEKVQGLSFSGIEKTDTLEINNDPAKDPDLIKLNEIAEKVKNSGEMKDKIELLKQEEKILWQEIENPEKYFDRAKIMNAIRPLPEDPKEYFPMLQNCALTGLWENFYSLFHLKVPIENVDAKYPAIEKIIKKTPDDSPMANEIKYNSLCVLNYLYEHLNPNNKDSAKNLLLDTVKTGALNQNKEYAFNVLVKKLDKNDPALKEIQDIALKQWQSKDADIDTKRTALVNLGKSQALQLKEIIPEILKDDKANPALTIAAAWCAGRVRSEENFNLLTNIINSPKSEDKDLELKEMALHSFALYVRKHPQAVKEILDKVSKTDSALNDVASILLDKVTGKYNTKDYFINKFIPNKSNRGKYKKTRESYIPEINNFNTRQKNNVDQGLIPFFSKTLNKMSSIGAKMSIIHDTITAVDKKGIGKRSGDGRFNDSGDGISIGNLTILSDWGFKRSDNGPAHEFLHGIHRNLLDDKDCNKITRLYNIAVNGDKCLDGYASWNEREYLAQGYEAYVSAYKPHKDQIDSASDTTSHTRSVLKRKDPALYEFIEYIIGKYGNSKKPLKTKIE